MRTRIKGNRIRLKGINELKDKGYLVDVVEKTGRFIKQKDLFGLFDVIYISPVGFIGFVQFRANRKPNLKPYKGFRNKYNVPWIKIEVWIWKDYFGFNKINI